MVKLTKKLSVLISHGEKGYLTLDKEGPDVREELENIEENQEIEIETVENKAVESKSTEKEFVESNTVDGNKSFEDTTPVGQDEISEDNINQAVENFEDMEDESPVLVVDYKSNKGKGWKKVIIIASSMIAFLFLIGLYLGFTDHGNRIIIGIVSDYSYPKLTQGENIEVNKPIVVEDTSDSSPDKAIVKPLPQEEQKIFNILLVGEENFEGAANTDTMMVATVDSKNNQLKLTSLMRDIYVEIPDHKNNKLNAPFAMGGIDLLYETIELNFGLKMDGYVLVNYSAFEDIIDYMDGVEITLTGREARYLNRTNYISNPVYRIVKEGSQIMNGNQALGYSRIRSVSTGKESDDFGRTSRQRIVLESLFDQVKSMNLIDLGLKMNHILNNIQIETDITKEEYTNYLEMAFKLRNAPLITYRVPENKDYMNEIHQIGKLNQEVLVPKNWDTTNQKLHEFIYGNE